MTTAIILLNWNGATDTIECLTSLYRTPSHFYIVLVDNSSEDDSVTRILQFLQGKGIKYRNIKAGEQLNDSPADRECIVYETRENLGFARGNNAGVRLLANFPPDRYLLLNNDTIVEPDFLDRLIVFHQEHPEYVALTPLICFNNPRTLVWNAGGRQFWGMRKYYYARRSVSEIRENGFLPVTFITGCALFMTPDTFTPEGVPLTERFFFGEEDFEFCLRQNKAKRKMACVLDSKIYHKVNASISTKGLLGRTYINTLNRLIDIRLHYGRMYCCLWASAYLPYVLLLLLRQRYGFRPSVLTLWRAFFRSFHQDGVSQADFIAALQH